LRGAPDGDHDAGADPEWSRCDPARHRDPLTPPTRFPAPPLGFGLVDRRSAAAAAPFRAG
jgi:hypothetical protein